MTSIDVPAPPDGLLTKIGLQIATASRLQRRQLLGVVERGVRHAVVPRLPIDVDRWYERQVPERLHVSLRPVRANTDRLVESLSSETRRTYRTRLQEFENGRIAFAGREAELDADLTVEWDDDQLAGAPLYWWLQYQSLPVLDWFTMGTTHPARSETFVSETLDRWLETTISRTTVGSPEYLRRDWIPHAVSLRVLRLCRYCAWLAARDMLAPRSGLVAFLYKNATFLRNHIEHDVGGNHLVENAIAMLVAGLVFEDGADWASVGRRLLIEAAETQFLSDGGHFERSPMYHVMVLRRYVTAVDLLERYGEPIPDAIRETARDATVFLRSLSPPDDRIPLLNDSVFGEVLSLPEVLRYADAASVATALDRSRSARLEGSGYYWLGTGDDRMLIDGGAVGPPHLPGHSHVDLLSVLLWIDGQRVLTDTGVFQYADDDRRVYARSVRAHNTVQIGESGPIRVGGQYLMGSRVDPTVLQYDEANGRFVGRYRRSNPLGEGYQHTRRVAADLGSWRVTDVVRGASDRTVTSRLHFHPETSVEPEAPNEFGIAREDGDRLGTLRVAAGVETDVCRTPYYPRFGEEHARDAVEMSYTTGENTFEISTEPR